MSFDTENSLFMEMLRIVVIVAAIVVTIVYASGAGLDVKSAFVLDEAKYALSALSELSESEIYHTLTLSKIISASKVDGVFHDNVMLELELESPHFKSGKTSEVYSMIVMTHKEDGAKSIAIDEFPVMNEEKIYEFQIEKIKRKRKQKRDILVEMEQDAIAAGVHPSQLNDALWDEPLVPGSPSIEDTLTALDTASAKQARLTDSRTNLQPRLSGDHLRQEQQIAEMSLTELFSLASGARACSEYQQYRSRSILDNVLQRRNRR